MRRENGQDELRRGDITGRIKTINEAHEMLPVMVDMWRMFKRLRVAVVAILSVAIAGYVTAEYFHRFADQKDVQELKTRTTIVETKLSDLVENVKSIGHAVGARMKE